MVREATFDLAGRAVPRYLPILLAILSLAPGLRAEVAPHAAGPSGNQAAPPATFADPGAQIWVASREVAPAPAAEVAPTTTTTKPTAGRLLGQPALPAGSGPRRTKQFGDYFSTKLPQDSTATIAGALAVVLGLFLMGAWVVRKSLPQSQRPLPKEVVEVLGRMPLAGKQSAQLVRVGSKLVLIATGADGAKPLVEITDPAEVQRLLALCEARAGRGAKQAFDEIFDELSRQPAPPGFLGETPPLVDRQRLADAYARTPGGRGHA